MHIDDSLVYLLAVVTVAVLMAGLARALQGPPQSPEARRRAMLASHRRSTGLLIGTFAPPPTEKLAGPVPAPMARNGVEPVTAAVGGMPQAAPPEPIRVPAPAPAFAALESLPADIGLRIEPVYARRAASGTTSTEESIPLDAVPALVALTTEFARPDAIVTLDAAPTFETLEVVAVSPQSVAGPDVPHTQSITTDDMALSPSIATDDMALSQSIATDDVALTRSIATDDMALSPAITADDVALTRSIAAAALAPEPALADSATPAAAGTTPVGLGTGETDDVWLCLRAYEAGEHAAVGETAARLARTRSSAKRARKSAVPPVAGEQVALWSILGLSRRALGEAAGARAAFDSAARWLPDGRSALPAPLVDAASVLGRHLLHAGEDADSPPEMRYLALRLAAACLEWSTTGGAPSDDLAALVARARATFAAASEQRIVELIGRRDFTAAQRLVRETLGSPLVGDDRRDAFRDLLWTTLTAEVDQLVGEARDGRRAADPLKGLAAAAAVVSAIPADLLSAARRDDLARRVWAGHLRLGLARADQGDLDGAMAPLVHAVETSASDPDRHAEACGALARTVGVLVERLGAESLTELRDGDLDAALAASRRLSEVLDQALARGLSPEDLRAALERRQDVLLSIAEGRPA